jgi:hypothetical protein
MPQTHPHRPDPSPERPPVGVFLVPPRRQAPLAGAVPWHGIDPQRLAWLIRHYTTAGDIVLDVDAHPTVTRAARYLRRQPAVIATDGTTTRVRLIGVRARPARLRRCGGGGVKLLLADLPRPGNDRLGLRATADALQHWHRLLRPGGFLLAAVTTRTLQPGCASHRSMVISAARVAGLRYHQHLPVLLVPLPEAEPRTDPATAATTPPALVDGRHLPIHVDVLAFAATTITEDVADA